METPREVQEPGGERLTWSCVPALATGHDGKVPVVCTPSGGARSVRLELLPDWREAHSDEEMLAAIAAAS